MDTQQPDSGRRRILKVITIGGVATTATLLLPSKWAKPVVQSVIVPAHAQASPPECPPLTKCVNPD